MTSPWEPCRGGENNSHHMALLISVTAKAVCEVTPVRHAVLAIETSIGLHRLARCLTGHATSNSQLLSLRGLRPPIIWAGQAGDKPSRSAQLFLQPTGKQLDTRSRPAQALRRRRRPVPPRAAGKAMVRDSSGNEAARSRVDGCTGRGTSSRWSAPPRMSILRKGWVPLLVLAVLMALQVQPAAAQGEWFAAGLEWDSRVVPHRQPEQCCQMAQGLEIAAARSNSPAARPSSGAGPRMRCVVLGVPRHEAWTRATTAAASSAPHAHLCRCLQPTTLQATSPPAPAARSSSSPKRPTTLRPPLPARTGR